MEQSKNGISASIIADSLNEYNNRLTTFVLTFPRIVLAEFNTHRMFSRNSASSRAIPFKKMLKMVQEDPFIPIKWMKEHSGMQGSEYITGEKEVKNRINTWLRARDSAIKYAEELSSESMVTYHSGDTNDYDSFIPPVTKQICNRLLEPFMWHTVIVTASEWQNFFALRAHDAAEIHIQELAYKMLEEYNNSTPKHLKAGEWHIPFGDRFDEERIKERKGDIIGFNTSDDINVLKEYVKRGEDIYKVKIATARCARVSYMNFEGKDDYEADIKLHDKLLESGHMSPAEHCAIVMPDSNMYGNFKGFKQYRKFQENENRSDIRVIIK